MTRRTSIYVDGFNLYYGALKGTRFRWLNIHKLAQLCLLPDNEINAVHYYTARVKDVDRKNQPRDQQVYFKALRTIPQVSIHFGRFLSMPKTRRLVRPVPGLPEFVEVRNTEERGSDVNLGVPLVHHAWQDKYDVAVVISNDTDLCEPIRIAREELGKVVGILSPRTNCSPNLKDVASFVRFIQRGQLRDAQFADRLQGSGIIVKPANW